MLEVLNYTYKNTNDFKSPGVILKSSKKKYIYMIAAADRSYWGLMKLLNSKGLTKETKIINTKLLVNKFCYMDQKSRNYRTNHVKY